MEFNNPYMTAPPPYSRLEEDSKGGVSQVAPTPNDEHKDAVVTISIEQVPPQSASSRFRNRGCLCNLSSFLCGCSLRTGCIVISVMYALSSAFYGIGVVSYFILAQLGYIPVPFPPIMGVNVAIYDATVGIFVVIFLSLGIHKEKWHFLYLGKWMMVLDLVLNTLEEIILLSIGAIYPFLINLVIQAIPIYFIICVHSYEKKLKTPEKKSPEITDQSSQNE